MIAFDEAAHEYRVQGAVVPHVTGILKDLTDYRHVDPEALERARQEGVAIHKMVELDVHDQLDIDSLPEWLHPRYSAWRKFLADTGFVCEWSERRVYHPVYRYAGTLDLKGPMRQRRALIDLKRSFYGGRVIGLQLAAYANAADCPDASRYALQLRDNGEYRLEPFEDKNDFNVFLACLTRKRFLENNR